MPRTAWPTRRFAGPRPPATTGRSPKASRGKAIAASSIVRSARARRHGRRAAACASATLQTREPAHRRGLRRALPRQRS
jgi:hypothetical protein